MARTASPSVKRAMIKVLSQSQRQQEVCWLQCEQKWSKPQSQQHISPIGFLFWNFRHRLVRYYWKCYGTFTVVMMSYFAVERYTSVKWNERFDMGFLTWHSLAIWKLCFLSCRKRPGCCGPPLWQVIMEFGRFLTKNQFYLWSFLSGPFVVTLQCFSCTIPSSLLLCI